ncbi:MAG: hypothetical protein RBT63_00750 [Bdellovibrionales bacterium]|jgi:hypothetical protein|nr:hypothetical protein [Bdellovibrionales bacterium]
MQHFASVFTALMLGLGSLLTNSAHAGETSSLLRGIKNPLIRVCVTNQGTFETHEIAADQLAFCRWGQTVIDSQSLLSNLDGIKSIALIIIENDYSSPSCRGLNGVSYPVGNETFCIFKDFSALSLTILQAESIDSARLHLKEVIAKR